MSTQLVTLTLLDEETKKYALACSRTRPTDVVQVQKTFIELYKQYRGDYMGSLLTGFVEGMLGVGSVDFDSKRYVTAASAFANANRKGYQLFGSLGGGFEFGD